MPTPNDPTLKPSTAVLAEEISAIEDPLNPLASSAVSATTPYLALLATSDTVLQQKGGIAHLNVYRELLRDDQVASVWQQRRLAVTRCETVVEPGAEDAASQAAASPATIYTAPTSTTASSATRNSTTCAFNGTSALAKCSRCGLATFFCLATPAPSWTAT